MADSINTDEIDTGGVDKKPTPGQILREARFAQDQSEAQVASRLYLSRSFVKAIENDQYDKLPGTTFVRGYLRSYARLVNIPPENVIEAFEELGIANDHTPLFVAPVTRVKKEVGVNDNSVKWVTYIIIATLIGLVVIWWRSHNEKLADVVADPTTVTVPESATGNAGADIEPAIKPIQGNDIQGSLDDKASKDGAAKGSEKVINSDQLRDVAPGTPTSNQSTRGYRRRA